MQVVIHHSTAQLSAGGIAPFTEILPRNGPTYRQESDSSNPNVVITDASCAVRVLLFGCVCEQ